MSFTDRQTKIDTMAAELRRYDATATEALAQRCLMGRGWPIDDIMFLSDDALALARQPETRKPDKFEAVLAAVNIEMAAGFNGRAPAQVEPMVEPIARKPARAG